MKISLIAAAALSATALVAACAPPSTKEDAEQAVTKELGLSGGDCLQCAQDALSGACQQALDDCAADLEGCLDGTLIEDIAMCLATECGSCLDAAGSGSGSGTTTGGPSTDPVDPGNGGNDPGGIPGGLGGNGGGDDGGTCPPGGGCDDCGGGCDDCGGGGCDLDQVCEDFLVCEEDCWNNTADDFEYFDCLVNVCGASEELAIECGLL